jgi:hypothetical protein
VGGPDRGAVIKQTTNDVKIQETKGSRGEVTTGTFNETKKLETPFRELFNVNFKTEIRRK